MINDSLVSVPGAERSRRRETVSSGRRSGVRHTQVHLDLLQVPRVVERHHQALDLTVPREGRKKSSP